MNHQKEITKMIASISLLALAVVIDVIFTSIPGLNLSMPFGGKLFGLSMLPIVLIGLLFGLKYGLISGLIFALYNFGIDYLIYLDTLRVTLEGWTGESWSFGKILALILLDYVIPFMAFGLSGLFKDALRDKRQMVSALTFVSLIRLVSSSLSGVLLWSSSIKWASDQVAIGAEEASIATKLFSAVGNDIWLYSIGYNFIYIFTTFILVTTIMLLIQKRLIVLSEDFQLLSK